MRCAPQSRSPEAPFDKSNRRDVRRGPVKAAKVTWLAPHQLGVLDELRLPGHQGAIERGEVDDPEVVFMPGRGDFVSDGDVAPKFLVDLALQGILSRLAGFDLAARKLPHPWQGAARSALDAQHLALRNDDRAHDVDLLLHVVPFVMAKPREPLGSDISNCGPSALPDARHGPRRRTPAGTQESNASTLARPSVARISEI